VGVPPIHVVKTEVTLDEILEKLSSLEKSLPNILDNASKVNESIESIGDKGIDNRAHQLSTPETR
jgi:hypothetical protein